MSGLGHFFGVSSLLLFASPLAIAQDYEDYLELTFPLLINGEVSGNIAARIAPTGGQPLVERASLFARLTSYLGPQTIADLEAGLPAERFLSVADLRAAGLEITYTENNLRFEIKVREQQALVQFLSIEGDRAITLNEFERPSRVSAALTVSVLSEYTHQASFGETGSEPTEAFLTGFANMGGIEGVNLAFDLRVREEQKTVRNRVLLFKDDFDRALRAEAGDIDPKVSGFQSSPDIGGISISRRYEEIQPFRDIRPSGNQGLFLERESEVEIVVNGITVRTLRLAPGRYELRDFPFLDATNDVEFFVEDEVGRRQVGRLSLFNADGLLEPGLSDFSATIGVLRDTNGDGQDYGDDLAFTGFYERGISNQLTLGGNLQASSDQTVIGARAAVASDIGQFVIDVATSQHSESSSGHAGTISFRQNFGESTGITSTLDLSGSYYSESFMPLQQTPTVQPREWDAAGRLTTQLPQASSITIGFRRSKGRRGVPDEARYDLGYTKLFGRVNVSANLGYDDVLGDLSGRIGVNIRIGDRVTARSSYDSRRGSITAELQRNARLGLNDLSGRLGYENRDSENFFTGEALFRSNRFEIEARHSYLYQSELDSQVDQSSELRITSGIAFADGSVALGRRTDEGFAIARRHPTLKSTDIGIHASYAQTPVAKIDRLGAVAVPFVQNYQPQRIDVDVQNLPAGYDLEQSSYEILPGAASGYNFRIGSDASYTLIGTLSVQDSDLYLASGSLVPVLGGEARKFFTNRSGRFVVERVKPGTYSLMIDGIDKSATVVVEEEDDALVDLGIITLE